MDEDYETEEENLLPDGTFAIQLSQEMKESLEMVPNWDLSALEPQKIIHLDRIREDLAAKGESSDFFSIASQIQTCKLLEPLIIYDPTLQYGTEFLICLNGEAKYGYLQAEEDANLALVDNTTPYVHRPPSPKQWLSFKSDNDIERDWVVDTRPKIRLQIKRSAPRQVAIVSFQDRDPNDVSDGYVACDSYKDNREWTHVKKMERGMQGVPILVEGSSQTELKHPKNVFTQYEPRVFSEEEVEVIWNSEPMKRFLTKMDDVLKEVAETPDIMGDLREEIEAFYKRDHVDVVEETELTESMFFTDLNFSHNLRVTQIRWHPALDGILAMSVMQNTDYESYLENLSQRLVTPNMVMIWSTHHPLFPQILLRSCDDVTKFEWHPNEDPIIIGGCMNGQVVTWDIEEYVGHLKSKTSIWDHRVILQQQTEKLHIQDGFIPVLYWSAESNITFSHKSSIEDFHWLPKNVWFSYDSAYPKLNTRETQRQFITCAAESYILVWDLRRPPAESGLITEDDDTLQQQQQQTTRKSKRATNWEKLKAQSAIPRVDAGGGTKWSPAIGKYQFLNKIWKPVHKICFLDPNPPPMMPNSNERERDPLLKMLITALSVSVKLTHSSAGASAGAPKDGSARTTSQQASIADNAGTAGSSIVGQAGAATSGYESDGAASNQSLEMVGLDGLPIRAAVNPSQQALPTMLMAGTILGSIFRADLSKNKVDVETNNLLCTIEWITPVHDGPVKTLIRSPFLPHLLLSVGGYSFAVWTEGAMARPVLLHFVGGEQFTGAAWSLTHASYIFFAGERGNLQVWDITKRKSEPFQVQNIAGRTINAICLHQGLPTDPEGFYVDVADDSGSVRLMKLPKHLWQSPGKSTDNLYTYMENEICKKQEKDRLRSERIRRREGLRRRTLEEEMEDDTKIDDSRDEFITFFFRRERVVMAKLYGGDEWKKHLRHPELKRDKYVVEDLRRESSSSSTLTATRRQSIVSSMVYKSKGVASLMKF